MNYLNIYNALIASRQLLYRSKGEEYFESHHILPKSLGGSNKKINLVLLTAREHYLAHWLLYRIHEGANKAKMAYAFFKLTNCNSQQKRIFSSRDYERAKLALCNISSENRPMFGKKMSQEQKDKLRKSKLGDKNPQFGKASWNKGLTAKTSELVKLYGQSIKRKFSEIGHPMHGRVKTEEHRKNLSLSHRGKVKTEEHRKNLSRARIGQKASPEALINMSRARKGIKQQILVCPHCQKSGGTTMHRWHFDKCPKKS